MGPMLGLPHQVTARSKQSAPRWPQQLIFPVPWLCRLGPAPHRGTWLIGRHPHTVVTCPPSLPCASHLVLLLSSRRELWRCCFGLATSALVTLMYRSVFGQPVEKGATLGNMEQVSSEVDV